MKAAALFVAMILSASLWSGASARNAGLLSAEWAADWSARNLDAVMALYVPEPVFLPTVGPRWEGSGTIRKNFAGLLAKYNPHIVLHSIKTDSSGDLAYDDGTYEEIITPLKSGKPIATRGAYLFLSQRQKNGDWKILEQVWTDFDQPPKL